MAGLVDWFAFESSVKLVWSPMEQEIHKWQLWFESSVKLVWSPIAQHAST